MAQRSGRVSPLFAITGVLGVGGVAGCGVVYGVAAGYTPWGVTNPLALLPLLFGAAYISILAARFGKLRSLPVAWLYTVVAAAAFMAAAAVTLQQIAGHSGTVLEYLGERRQSGVTLLGSVAVKGVWLVLCWIAMALLVLFATNCPLIESRRPFCEACRSWAWKPRWTFRLKGPAGGGLARIKQAPSIESLTRITGGGDAATVLLCRLGVCRCGAVAALNVELRKISNGSEDWSGDSMLDDLPVFPNDAERLYRWAESHDPSMASRRPVLRSHVEEDVTLDGLTLPDGEPRTTYRWSGNNLASDCSADNPFTRALRRQIKAQGYAVIPPALRMARDHDELAYIAEACADWDGMPEWLARWGAAAPDRPEMLLIRGIHGVKWAWQARGKGWVPKNYDTFQDRLMKAEEDLLRAAAGRPSDPTPWAWLIYAGKGREHERETLIGHFKEAIRRAPHHRAAHSMLADALTPKWGGSAGKLHEFAQKASARAPAGSPVHVLVPEAHLQLAYDAQREQGDEGAFAAYLAQPAVQAELREANAKAFRIGGFKPGWETPRTRAWFAFVLWKAGLREEAAEHFRTMGRSSPWGVFQPNLPGMKDSVRRARRECGV